MAHKRGDSGSRIGAGSSNVVSRSAVGKLPKTVHATEEESAGELYMGGDIATEIGALVEQSIAQKSIEIEVEDEAEAV